MKRLIGILILCVSSVGTHWTLAQPAPQNAGTLVVVSGIGEVKRVNDQAHVTFMIEEQDKDKVVAASRANQKMKQGTEILKKEDPAATLKTRGYYTYPVYPDGARANAGQPPSAWRVGQYLDFTTKNVGTLPKTVAAVQSVLALNGLHFDLSDETLKDLDKKGIESAYRNLTDRVATIARAMGRNPSDAVFENIDFEDAGSRVPVQAYAAKAAMTRSDVAQVVEPDFEPGETTLSTRVVGKVRFK
jgi:uncharacterized protein YggE